MKKILFVEDDPILGPVYENQLKNAGYDTTLAIDGEAGLNALRQNTPDLVVLDVELPKVSGIQLLKILRSTEGLKDLPVIVFTSAFQQNTLNELKLQNPNRILPKSGFVPREVVQIIRELLNDDSSGATTASSAPAPAPAPAPTSGTTTDSTLQKRLQGLLEKCRRLVLEVNKQTTAEVRSGKLLSLSGFVHNLAGGATAAGLKAQAYFCEALETLAEEVAEDSDDMTESSLRTITQAVDFLFEEFDFQKTMEVPEDLNFKVLVVDDDAISRRAVCSALGRIKQEAIDYEIAADALQETKQQAFDLIFLDVDMPEINGFDLCAKIRETELNKATPVIFVTGLTDLQNRAQSMLSGGTDFIGKPFQFMELAVKSLIHLLRSKLR